MANASAVNQEAPERSILKVALAALAGSSIEWYDFFIYGTAAALVFPDLFFPGFGDTAGTILSYSTFAVGFVARPVGGLIFGHFGDKFGRKRALVTALILMGIGTTAIGLMPGYATIGIVAPILLVTLRFLQGVCIGGQWGGAVLLATESAPPEKRGFYGSFAQMGVPVAVLISNIIFLIIAATLGDDALVAWAWRIPFLLSVLLIGLGLYIQLKAGGHACLQAPPGVPRTAPIRGGAARGRRGRRLSGVGGTQDLPQGDSARGRRFYLHQRQLLPAHNLHPRLRHG